MFVKVKKGCNLRMPLHTDLSLVYSLLLYMLIRCLISHFCLVCVFFQLLAGELGLVSTKITKADKAEHIKRKRHIVPQTTTSQSVT